MAKNAPTIDDLLAAIGRRELSPLTLLYGEEEFLVEEAVQAIIDAVLGEGERGFNLDVLSATEHDVRDIVAVATAFPMMADRRVVVVKEVEKISGKDADVLAAYCESPPSTTCMVLISAKPDFRKKLYLVIRRTGVVVESKRLYESQLPSWITARVERQGRTIGPEACKLLTAYVGTSLREVQNELEKLSIYIGDRTEITADDVASVVGMSKEFSVFELQKAVGARDLRRAVTVLQRMLDAGENVPFILVMLTNYFTALWKLYDMRRKGVPQRDQATEAKIHPYFFQEYADALSRFTPAEVERSFGILANADLQVKSTSIEHAQIMTGLLVEILGQGEPAISG